MRTLRVNSVPQISPPVIDMEYRIDGGAAVSLGSAASDDYPIDVQPGQQVRFRFVNIVGGQWSAPVVVSAAPQIITAVIPPALGPLVNGDVIEDALSEDIGETSNYASTAGTIASVDVTITANAEETTADAIAIAGQEIIVTVLVTDSESNTRTFTSSPQSVAEGEPSEPTIGLGAVDWDADTKQLSLEPSEAGQVYWMTGPDAERSAAQVEAGTGAEASGDFAVTDEEVAVNLNITGTETDVTRYLHVVLKVGSDFSVVYSFEFTLGDAFDEPIIIETKQNLNVSTVTSLAVTFDDAPEEGELVLLFASSVGGSSASHNIDVPTGFTRAAPEPVEDTFPRVGAFFKVAGDDESATYTMNFSQSRRWRIFAARVVNPYGPNVVVDVGGEVTEDNDSPSGITITQTGTAQVNSMAFAAVFAQPVEAWDDWDGDWIEIGQTTETNSARMSHNIAAKFVKEAGTLSASIDIDSETGADNMVGMVFALKEDDE